ncbi:YIP1 family protein [Methanogenium sp. S4BF]|uniref:YIP1 family protein n=1 Tax=Methanogenium sp. S4BF TaxID=1789226 RepID=UPI0024170CA1|nr:YIP1 family protein [Methanogenium sp. S4BF]WFN34088.1 YIP1 family protein [Methanogenium sp. S4BF]
MTTSPSVRVKSHFFDLFLTQKRLILTQPDYPDAPQVDIVFSMVSAFSRGETAEGDPSLSLTVMSERGERTMVLAFDGGGGFKPADERDRLAELVAGMLGKTAPPPGPAPAAVFSPSIPDQAETEAPSSTGPAETLVSEPAPPVSVSSIFRPENEPAPEKLPVRPPSPSVSGLKAEHIIVKGREFTASLTPDTISLVRHEDPKAPPLTVRRREITGVVAKESAGGDPSLHLRVRAADGNERTMVLVFSEWYSGGRAPEREEWAAALTETAAAPVTPVARPIRPVRGEREAPFSPPTARPPGGGSIPCGAKFCTECGAPLTGSPRFCPNCGSPVGSGSGSAQATTGIRDLPFDAAIEDERPAKKQKPRQKREKKEKKQRQPRKKASFRFRSQELGLSEVPFIEKFFGFLAAPDDAFRYTRTDSFGQALVYLAAVLAIFAAVTSIVLHLFAGSLDAAEYPRMAALGADIVGSLLLIPRIVILGIAGILIWSLVMHILLRILGQSDDVTETFRTCAYAATPFGTVGLIPFFGPFLAAIWMLVLQYKGLVAADDVENRFALLAVAVPVILFGVIFSLFFSAGGSQ